MVICICHIHRAIRTNSYALGIIKLPIATPCTAPFGNKVSAAVKLLYAVVPTVCYIYQAIRGNSYGLWGLKLPITTPCATPLCDKPPTAIESKDIIVTSRCFSTIKPDRRIYYINSPILTYCYITRLFYRPPPCLWKKKTETPVSSLFIFNNLHIHTSVLYTKGIVYQCEQTCNSLCLQIGIFTRLYLQRCRYPCILHEPAKIRHLSRLIIFNPDVQKKQTTNTLRRYLNICKGLLLSSKDGACNTTLIDLHPSTVCNGKPFCGIPRIHPTCILYRKGKCIPCCKAGCACVSDD